ncbi:MAG: DUF4112 domain-containing protein [Azospirillaceae bacterium]
MDRRGSPDDGTLPSGRARELDRLAAIAHLLDDAFRIPGTGLRFGLDGLVGLVPVGGDLLAAGVSAAIVLWAWRLGAPVPLVARMLGNVVLDGAIGTIPVAGDLFDFGFKANRRNVALLRRYLERAG